MPNKNDFKHSYHIKIDGSDIPLDLANAIAEVVVDTSIDMPSMFTLRIHDATLKWVDSSLINLGKAIEIGAADTTTGSFRTIFKGDVTGVEPHFSSVGETFLVVRGYDNSYRLHRGVKTRVFVNMKDSDIVNKIASESGLSGSIDATSEMYEYVLQNNQTDMEFLQSRAERIGYHYYVDGSNLYFKKEIGGRGEVALKFLETLTSFKPCLSAVHQADTIQSKGWDPKKKEVIMGSAIPTSPNQIGYGKTGGAAAQQAFGSATARLVDRPVDTVNEANSLAGSLSSDLSLDFIQAEGTCSGNPSVVAGMKVKISGVGTRFSGTYLVTNAQHVLSPGEYNTHFSVNGRQSKTLSALVAADGSQAQTRGLINGVVTGVVTNVNDNQDGLGRIKVKFPWLDNSLESRWMRIASPMAGNQRGLMMLPEVNDEVLVAFEHGDINHPYMIGALWNGVDKPPATTSAAVKNGKIAQRIFKTTQGHTVTFDDSQGQEKITILSKSGHQIVLDDANKSITIKDQGGGSMVLGTTSNSMTIKVNGDFTVEAAKISMSCNGAMNLESKGTATMKGMSTSLEANTSLSLNGNAQTELKSSGIVTVQGSLVKIN